MSKSRGPAPSSGILLAAFGIIGELACLAFYAPIAIVVGLFMLVMAILFGNNKRGK